MPDEHVVFGPKAVGQIAQTVREVARRMMNPRAERGRWQGGGVNTVITEVRFRIVSSDPTTFTGLAEVLAWDYGFTLQQVPDLIAGSVIEICDPRTCFLNEPNVDLTGRQGTAVYRQGLLDDVCRTGYEPFPGVWEVDGLCCKLLSCDVVI